MMFARGEVVLIRMQFHQATGSKVRPALVVLETGDDDFVGAPVTSQKRLSEHDLAIGDWPTAGLNVPSWVRVHKMTVLAKADVVRRLGVLAEADCRAALDAILCRSFCPKDGVA